MRIILVEQEVVRVLEQEVVILVLILVSMEDRQVLQTEVRVVVVLVLALLLEAAVQPVYLLSQFPRFKQQLLV
jgi:hypothetical protein